MTSNPFTWWAQKLPLPRRKTEKIGPRSTRSYIPGIEQRYDTDLPWVVYTYGRIHDGFWPPWRSSRILGRAAVGCECAVCGKGEIIVVKLPRVGPVDGSEHPQRTRFKLEHLHRDRPHAMSWARPLLNPAAHSGGIDLDLLAMRLQADLNQEPGAKDG